MGLSRACCATSERRALRGEDSQRAFRDELAQIGPAQVVLPAGSQLARIYFVGGDHPSSWNGFRHYGPTGSRFDHHLTDAAGNSFDQARSTMYLAQHGPTCLAEFFQETRRIDRARREPRLCLLHTRLDLPLLDLTGTFTTRAGAPMAINTGPRSRVRPWARAFYDAYPQLVGLLYSSSMHGNTPCVVLNDRAEKMDPFLALPALDRALSDVALLDMLKNAAIEIGYVL